MFVARRNGREKPMAIVRSLFHRHLLRASRARSTQAGFTLIEVLAVVVIIGVIAAIAAPGWSAFVGRQRVTRIQQRVQGALQDAQRAAKQKKIPHVVSFRQNGSTIEYAFYPITTELANINAVNRLDWRSIASKERDGVSATRLFFCANVNPINLTATGKNASDSNKLVDTATVPDASKCKEFPVGNTATSLPSFTFDDRGNLHPDSAMPSDTNRAKQGLNITVALRTNNSGALIPGTKRCVKIVTLLGSMKTDRGIQDCASTTP